MSAPDKAGALTDAGTDPGDLGFTLSELLFALAILGVVLAAGWTLLNAASDMSDHVQARAQATEETRTAMDRVTTELRQASELPGMEGTGVFSEIGTGVAGFYADADHDDRLERVVYRRIGSRLTRTVTEATIVDGVYVFGAEPAGRDIISGIPADWSAPIFTFWAKDTGVQLSSSQSSLVSAVGVHLRHRARSGRRTADADNETWIKIRSVHNAVD